MGEFVNIAFNLLREHGLRLNPNLTMAVKALMQAEAIATALSPDSGLLGEGVKIIQEEAVKVVTADRVIERGQKAAFKRGAGIAQQPAGSLAGIRQMAEPI